ncbi:hypothetical protein [Trinickia fusca]|uniref:Uncharacterized protein n=1 Tax=Trinickia fusca TaxID=2419777 RepID=A0A494XCY3_9BURK|nr:hypothetical protein [Trinickia fusca]RKP46009.1 hypothetical protein D7S89_18720 [Trinickia fusca]
MSIALLLAFRFASPALVGLVVTRYLREVTMRLLTDICGTTDRAEFWVRVSAVLMVIAPLALVLLAARSPLTCLANDIVCQELVLRQTLVSTLIGAIVAVGSVAGVVSRYIPREPISRRAQEAAA